MPIKTAQFKIQGMNQDNSESAFPEKFAFEVRNMRIDARTDNTLLSLTNEKGNTLIEDGQGQQLRIFGNPIGYSVINNYLILFTHNPVTQIDYIYRIDTDGRWMTPNILFEGDLDFKENWESKTPLETLAWYENDEIQKVYWIDGLHQPRMINIVSNGMVSSIGVLYYGYDFVQKLELREDVEITQGSNGQFHSGMVQYFITYYNANGTESHIAWQSPLMFVTYDDTGGSPEDVIPRSFTLHMTGIDQHYDFLRLYCVQRTTLNGEVYVRKVRDFAKGQPVITYTDNGIVGEAVDSSYLLYVGGDELLSAGCFTQKDQVLFFGDIRVRNTFLPQKGIGSINVGYKKIPMGNLSDATGRYYHYHHQESDQPYDAIGTSTQGNATISTFKYLEEYRFGIQFQFDNGMWSNVLWIGDATIDKPVKKNNGDYWFALPQITLSYAALEDYINAGAKKVRPVCVFPSAYERNIICQGILCPTVYNVNDRVSGMTFSYGSWFSRPNAPDNLTKVYDAQDPPQVVPPAAVSPVYNYANYPLNPYAVRTPSFRDKGCWAEFRHNHGMPSPREYNGEIQMQYANNGGMAAPFIPAKSNSSLVTDDLITPYQFNEYYSNGFNMDQSIFTMHSPDIEFNDNIQNVALSNAKLRIIGYVPVNANSGDISIDASEPDTYKAYHWRVEDEQTAYVNEIPSSRRPEGFYEEKVGGKVNANYGWFNLINGPYWQDKLYNPHFDIDVPATPHDPTASEFTFDEYPIPEWIKFGFVIYPWQQHGSLSNGHSDDDHSVLKKKIISNLKYSLNTNYFEKDTVHYGDDGYWTSFNGDYDKTDTGLSDLSYIDSDNHFTMLKSPYGNGSISYDGNMDKLLTYNKNDWSPRLAVFGTYKYPDPYDPDVPAQNYWLKPNYIHADDSSWEPYLHMWYVDSDFSSYVSPDRLYYTVQQTYAMYNAGDYFIYGDSLQNNTDTRYYYSPILGSYRVHISYFADGSTKYNVNYTVNSDQPISMRYKCSPHIVMVLNNQDHYEFINGGVSYSFDNMQRCLPTAYKQGGLYPDPINPTGSLINDSMVVQDFGSKRLYFDPNYDNADAIQGCLQPYIASPDADFTNENHGFYWLAELYRDDVTNKFGGTSEEALMNNVWHVCGNAIDITGTFVSKTLDCTEGDTFYQRYDNLKTMPYSDNDENQVIEIVSFMCESRVNLDGRYDKLRGIDNAELIIPEAFNSINKVYSQLDNYLTYAYLREKDIHTYLPNTIIWSDKKINGEDVDVWTQLHTENFLDLEGKNGKINALKTFRNEIYAFQDSAIAQVLFNSRTALATVEGSPVQLASTGLVEGKQYISNSMGCLNKWSICETPSSLIFTDDLNKSIMAIGDGFENLSEKYGMSTWVQRNTGIVPWNLDFPEGSMVTYYDRNNKDILFITKDEALAYSLKLGAFTSFYSYGEIPFIVNYKDKVIAIRGNNNYTELWSQNTGYYNRFFGVYEPFGVTVIVNANPTTDKVFNTVEYRADFFDSNDYYQSDMTFSSIRAWNEYQDTYAQTIANTTVPTPNIAKKKFRMWRVNIPRHHDSMDRIRNPWTYIKLEKDNKDQYNGKVQLHDIQVHYTE